MQEGARDTRIFVCQKAVDSSVETLDDIPLILEGTALRYIFELPQQKAGLDDACDRRTRLFCLTLS